MIPKYLRISGFLSYQEPIELDFTGFDLACISGQNGAGKSSLLDAMTWALFGQARRRDDSVINSHAGAAEVVFDFWYEKHLYRVQRSKAPNKSTILEFYLHDDERWRPLTEHTMRETEARIEQTLRMDYETFINASFFLQGKADQFAQQRPGDRKRILGSILGLEMWETYRERAYNRRRRLELEQAANDRLLAEINAELNEEDARRARLAELKQNLKQLEELRKEKGKNLEQLRRLKSSLDEQRRLVDMLKGQLRAARERLDQRCRRLESRLAERQQAQAQLDCAEEVEAAYRRWQAARQELERWETVAANFRQYDSQRSAPLMAIESERSRLEQSRKNLRQQQREIVSLENSLPELIAELAIASNKVDATLKQLDLRAGLDSELFKLQGAQTEALAENKRLKAEMAELKERILRLKQASGVDCPLCGQPLNPEDRQKLIESLELQGRDLGDRYRANQEVVRAGDERQKTIQREIKNLQLVEVDLRQQQRTLDQLQHRKGQIDDTLNLWDANGGKELDRIEQKLNAEDYAQEARSELAKIDAALSELGYDAAEHDRTRKAELEGRATEEQLRQLEMARAALTPLQREIEDLQTQTAVDETETKTLQESFDLAMRKYEEDAANLPDVEQVEQELFDLQEQENRVRMQVGGATQAVEVLKTLRVRQVEKSEQRNGMAAQIARLRSLERAFSKDGVPALLIEQALPEIEGQANDILDRLTNGNMSVRFATQKEYKDKSRDDKRETLDILISDSAGWREYEMFSGGEAFRVNFAIRLALSRVLSQRAGARLQSLVIDEGFGSQDAEGRQRLLEAINMVRPDFAKILVITHLEELKDAFPARIEVEKTETGSQLRMVA